MPIACVGTRRERQAHAAVLAEGHLDMQALKQVLGMKDWRHRASVR